MVSTVHNIFLERHTTPRPTLIAGQDVLVDRDVRGETRRPLVPHTHTPPALTHLYVPAAQSFSSGDFNTSTSSSSTENVAVQSTLVTSPSRFFAFSPPKDVK